MLSRIRKVFTEYKEIKYLAYHDSLTGVLNRNWLYKNIDSFKYKYVFFIDINNLTEINKDGHTEGDKHIKRCVEHMKCVNSLLLRYAGDEFIMFSNDKNAICTCKLYCVGRSIIKNNEIIEAINRADIEMIKAKTR